MLLAMVLEEVVVVVVVAAVAVLEEVVVAVGAGAAGAAVVRSQAGVLPQSQLGQSHRRVWLRALAPGLAVVVAMTTSCLCQRTTPSRDSTASPGPTPSSRTTKSVRGGHMCPFKCCTE